MGVQIPPLASDFSGRDTMEPTVTVKDLSAVEKQIEVTVPADMVAEEVNSLYEDLRKSVKLKGFRKGKVPRSILTQYYRKQVEAQVINKIINDTYEKLIKEKQIHPVSQPIIDNEKLEQGKSFTYTARVEIQPEISLEGGYEGLEVEKEVVNVTEEDVDRYLEELRNHHAQINAIESDRPVQQGDFVVVDYTSAIDGEPIKSGAAKERIIEVKQNSFLPGFTSQLVGLRKGTNREITVSLPEDYAEKEIAGKTITFDLTIKDIKEKIVPQLDNNFARDMGEFETLEDLKEHLKKEVTASEEQRVKSALHGSLIKRIIEKNPFDVPYSLVEKQTEHLINDARARMRAQGLALDSSTMLNRELKESYRPVAEFQVKRSFILEAIAQKENLDVTPAEIKEQIKQLPTSTGADVNALLQGPRGQEVQNQIRKKVLEDKTLAFLEGKASILEKESSKQL